MSTIQIGCTINFNFIPPPKNLGHVKAAVHSGWSHAGDMTSKLNLLICLKQNFHLWVDKKEVMATYSISPSYSIKESNLHTQPPFLNNL